MKRKKRWIATICIGAALLGATWATKYTANIYVGPYVQEQLHTVLNGTVSYDTFHVQWDGSVAISNLQVKDRSGQQVLQSPHVTVSMTWLKVLQYPLGYVTTDALLGTIQIDSPQLYVSQGEDAKWNVESLLKRQDDSEASQFSGHIIVDNGTLHILFPKQDELLVSHVDAHIIGHKGQSLEVVANADLYEDKLAGKMIVGLGNSDDLSLYIQSDVLHMGRYVPYVSAYMKDVQNLDGKIRDIALSVERKGGTWRSEGVLSLEQVQGMYGDYSIANTKGTLQFKNDMVSLMDITTNVNGEYIRFHGSVGKIFSQDPELAVHARMTETSVESLWQKGVTGYVTIDALIHGTLHDVQATVDLKGHDISYEGIGIENLVGRIAYGKDKVHFTHIVAHVQDGQVLGSGTYDIQTGTFEVEGKGENISLSALPIPLDESIEGRVNGRFTAKGINSQVNALDVSIDSQHIGYGSLSIQSLGGALHWDGQQLRIQYVNGRVGNGEVSLYGILNTDEVDVHVSGKDIPLPSFQTWSPYSLGGYVAMDGHIAGPLTSLQGIVTISGKDIIFGSTQIENATVKAHVDNHLLSVETGQFTYKETEYSLTGSVDLGESQDIALQGVADKVRIETVLPNVADIPMTGWATTKLSIYGTLRNPLVRGYVKAWDGSIYGKLYEKIEAVYRYEDGTLQLPHVEMITYGSSITASGMVDKEKLDIDFLGEAIPMAPFTKQSKFTLLGYVAAQGHLGGTLDSPVFEGTVTSKELQLNDSLLHDVLGSVYMTPQVLHLQEISFKGSNDSTYEVKGGMTLDDEQRLFGYAKVERGDVEQILKVSHISIPKLKGQLDGTITLGGNLDNPTVSVNGKIHNVAIDEDIVGDATLDASYGGRIIDIRTLRLPVKKGILAAEGKVDLDGETNLQVAANQVPVSTIMPLLEVPFTADGRWNMIVHISGKTKSPKVEFSSEIESPYLNGIPLDQVSLLGTMTDDTIYIQQGMVKKSGTAVKIRGKAPLAALIRSSNYVEPDVNQQFDFHIDLNEANVSVLPMIVPSVKASEGIIKGDVHVTGTVNEVMTNGTIELKDGMIQLDSLKKPLTKWHGLFVFKDNHVDMTSGAFMGKGSAGLSGNWSWKGLSLDSYYGALQINGLEIDHENYRGPLDGELYMVSRNGIPTLVGKINLHDVVASIPLDLESGEGGVTMGLDVTIEAGKHVRLYNSLLYDMVVTGQAKFEGTLEDPKASGQFKMNKGSLKYLTNRFRITEGTANFVSGSILPELQVHSMANVKNYRVGLTASGPVTQMKLKLTSEPSLSERQIISLLTFGRSVGNTTGVSSDDANSLLTASLQSFAFGYVEDVLQNSLGLDLVNITTGSLDRNDDRDADEKNNFNVQIGKYIIPDLMVTLTRGLNNDRMSYGIQYDINQKIGITGWVTNTNKSFFGGQWRYRF